MSLGAVVRLLEGLVPSTFEGLEMPFGVGVMNERGEAELVTSGPLAQAVVASMAIPRLFSPVRVGERLLADGGMVDRTALESWRRHRPARDVLMHLVESTGSSFGGRAGDGDPEGDAPGLTVVRSPRSRASFLSLGDVPGRLAAAQAATAAALTGRAVNAPR